MIREFDHGAEGIVCVHHWRKIVTPHGVFTNNGTVLIYEGNQFAEVTLQIIRDRRFHATAKRTGVFQ